MSGDLDTFFVARWGEEGNTDIWEHWTGKLLSSTSFSVCHKLTMTAFVNANVKHFFFVWFFILYLWPTVPLEHLMPPQLLLHTGFTRFQDHKLSVWKTQLKTLELGKKVNTAFWRQKPLLLTVWLLAVLASAWGFQCPQSALCCLIKHDYWIRNMKIWQRQLSLLGMKGPVIWWWRWCWHSFRRNQFCNKQLFSPSILSPVFCPQYFAPSEVSYLQYFFL